MTISSVSEEQSEGSPRGADLSEGALRQRGADLSEGALRQRGPDHSEESSDGGRVPRPVRRYTAWQRRKAERLRVLCEQVKQLNGGRAEGGRAPKSQVAIKESIREMALSQGGLMEDRFRRVLWPQLFEIDPANVQLSAQTEAELKERCDQFNQVTMDVFRTLRRFPPGITDDDREMYQHQLTGVVCQVLLDHPELYYYQGYHDVALTLLLVVGQRVSLALIEKLSKSHLGTFMEPSMKSTAHLLNYLYPILKGEDEELFAFMLKSEVTATFSLPWVITWFSHSLEDYDLIMRLYDAFLSSPPLLPVYLSASIVLSRREDVLSKECEMAAVHGCLAELPPTLDWEGLLNQAYLLMERYPPQEIDDAARELIQYSPHYPLPDRSSWLSETFGPVLGPLSLAVVGVSIAVAVCTTLFKSTQGPSQG